MKTSPLALLAAAVALSACVTQGPDPDPIPPSPVVVSFTVTPAKVLKGGTATIAWQVENATKVSIADVNKGAVSGVDDQLSGSVTVTIDASTAFLLTATNERGARAIAVASAGLDGADERGIVFSAYPSLLPAGEKGLLVWAAPGAKTVTITPAGGAALDLGGQVAQGSVEIDPTADDTTYALDADGHTRGVTVQRAPGVTELNSSATLAEPGASLTVSWKATNATSLRLVSPGRGVVFQTTDGPTIATGSFMDTVPVLPSGSVLTYRAEVDGHGDTVTRAIDVVVGTAPAVLELTAPEYVKTGNTFTVAWKTANADQVTLLAGTVPVFQSTTAAQAANGNVSLNTPAATTTYTLVARNSASGDAASDMVTVDPVGDVTIGTFTAAPTTVPNGGDAVTLTWSAPNARRVRVVERGGLTVAYVAGTAAASGTVTVYPNAATTTYELIASNTIDADVNATADVTVTAPVPLTLPGGAPLFEGQPTADIEWTLGGSGSLLEGFPHGTVDVNTSSTGFDDIAATGMEVPFTSSDDASYVLTAAELPAFETFFFGRRAEGVRVSTNGWLAIGSSISSSTPTPGSIPGTTYANVIAPLWADLELGSGKVVWQVKGAAPNQALIVQFDHVQVAGEPTSDLVFQAKVTQSGVVTFEYQTLTFGSAGAPATSIGVSGPNATGINSTVPAAGSSLTFFGPKASPLTAVPGAHLPAGGFVKIGSGFAHADLSAAVVRAGEVAITEVMYAPAAAVTEGEWIEVANSSSVALDLQGWTLDFGGGNTHTIATSVPLPAGAVKVLGMTSNTANNDGVAVDYAYGTTVAMDDMTGSVSLSNPAGFTNTATWTAGTVGVARVFDPSPIIDASDSGTSPAPTPRNCDAAAADTYGSQPTLQLGSPGTVRGCFGYKMSLIPVSYFDISGTGTLVPHTSTDDSRVAVSVAAAPLTVFGTSFSDIVVSTNGWLRLGSSTGTSSAFTNKTKPSTSWPNGGVIAPFWDDLKLQSGGGGVFTKRVAANEDPNNPTPHWIVQWHKVRYTTGDDLNLEVKLFDSGPIEYHYATMSSGSSSNYGDGNSATVWLENLGATQALTWSVNSPSITPNMAIRFTPVP